MLGLSPKQMSLIWFLWAAAICRAVVSVLSGKKMVPQAGMDKGHTATAGTPKDYGCRSHREAGALWLCGNQFQLLCSWLAFWLASTVCKYLQEKLREWDPSLAQASLAMECWSWLAGNFKGSVVEPHDAEFHKCFLGEGTGVGKGLACCQPGMSIEVCLETQVSSDQWAWLSFFHWFASLCPLLPWLPFSRFLGLTRY